MATRDKRKLAAINKENCDEHPRSNLAQNSKHPRSQKDYITQVSQEIMGRVTKRFSKENSTTESRILGALARLDDFLMNPLLQGHSGTTTEAPGNALSTNQGTNEDNSQNDPHPEAGLFHSQMRPRQLVLFDAYGYRKIFWAYSFSEIFFGSCAVGESRFGKSGKEKCIYWDWLYSFYIRMEKNMRSSHTDLFCGRVKETINLKSTKQFCEKAQHFIESIVWKNEKTKQFAISGFFWITHIWCKKANLIKTRGDCRSTSARLLDSPSLSRRTNQDRRQQIKNSRLKTSYTYITLLPLIVCKRYVVVKYQPRAHTCNSCRRYVVVTYRSITFMSC